MSITSSDIPTGAYVRDCDGSLIPFSPAEVTVTRTAPLTDELVVPLAVTGDLAGRLDPVPVAVFFPGAETARVSLWPIGATPGTLTVTLLDGADHDLGVPASVDLVVGPPASDPQFDCLSELSLDPALASQVIEVGDVPEPLGLHVPRPSPLQFFVQVRGALPPGLTYANDVWGGAATTPGTYHFAVSPCVGAAGVCLSTAEVTITVRAAEAPAAPAGPDGSAAPAVPVVAAARFTG